jgi:formylglycine-generating enzyme required for sulfatase activity
VAGWEPVNGDLEPDPSEEKGGDRPVTDVGWEDAAEFCARLSRETGRDYRLPSEAMWEYACRAGTETAFSFGEMIAPEVANYDWDEAYDGVTFEAKSANATVAVGSFPANPWGLQEMHGNVWEWCEDHWHGDYEGAPTDGSAWVDEMAEADAERVLRGGSWINYPWYCRSASRDHFNARFDYYFNGFRVVVCLPPRTP